ncbi:MAG: tetratricopeptide repeat protein [Fimbriimonadaceae bacterium]
MSHDPIDELREIEMPQAAEAWSPPSARKSAEENAEYGEAALRDGRNEDAAFYFAQAVEMGADASAGWAVALEALGREEEAAEVLKKQSARGTADPLEGLADLARANARFREAFGLLEQAIRREPTNPAYRIKLAEALRDAGFPKRAASVAKDAVTVAPDNAFLHYWLADLSLELGDDVAAVGSFRAAIDLSPGDDHLFARAAVALWRTGDREKAIESIEYARQLDPAKTLYQAMAVELKSAHDPDFYGDVAELDPYDQEMMRRFRREVGLSDG